MKYISFLFLFKGIDEMKKMIAIFLLLCVTVASGNEKRYKPEWSDLDTRPLPEWYDKAKIGIFIHWGVYSVPSFHSEWFWDMWRDKKEIQNFMQRNYPPYFTYQEFAPMFTAEFFSPEQFAELFYASGAKYVVLTSKHHEGFTLFPSSRSYSWNSVDVGPHRDLVGELAWNVRTKGLKFGVYHSLYEWFNPIYLQDKDEGFLTRDYVDNKLWPDIKQLINSYKPSVFWSDGDWEADDSYWNSTGLLAYLYNDSPVKDEIVVNDRWGRGTACKHGDFYNCADRYNPGHLVRHKWENAFTLDKKSWGYRRDMNVADVMTIQQLIKEVVSTVSCGGNALINVGPTKEGTIAPIFQERLLALGDWLKVNGEAIYSSSPWVQQNDTKAGDVWYTCTKANYDALRPVRKPNVKDNVIAIYVIFLKWPQNNVLKLHYITPYLSVKFKISLLGYDGYLQWKTQNGETAIVLPDKAELSSDYAWTLKINDEADDLDNDLVRIRWGTPGARAAADQGRQPLVSSEDYFRKTASLT
ncbi:tissue alpha-L-fucosidase-like [Plodia interpunctella]|uniref:tissue alpha-L-fucosidase-like n=1 Tax=Plodia interpunctella TaxID=58824 RepID=UPI0023682B77|nr:tissue alpha-L-fucosidase-like [Plodia interpunctella]